MSGYLKKWRKYNAQLQALADNSESEDDAHSHLGQRQASQAENDIENNSQTDHNQNVNCYDHPEQTNSDSQTENSHGELEQTATKNSESDLDSETQSTAGDTSSDVQSDDATEKDEPELGEQLAGWATKHKCSRAALNEILEIMRKHGHRLPKDARTLLQTPRIIEAIDKCGGRYIYMGIETGLLKVFTQCPNLFKGKKEAPLSFSVDGVPLFKSSNAQLWPILCSVGDLEPFVVALYFGNSKPNSAEEYLSDLLTELSHLKENGVDFEGINIKVTVDAFICDAPARAFLKCTKGHNAYFGCERCVLKGKWNGRVTFGIENNQPSPLRTEELFNSVSCKDHQVKKSPLIDAGISCIKRFPLDYMHLVCLGVVKRILSFLKQGPRECKLSQNHLKLISDKLAFFNGKMPRDFARQPRTLHDLDKWKATEFRQFVLYTGPVVLRSVVSEEFYNHFLSLTVALSIMLESDNGMRNSYLDYSSDLMVYFLKKCEEFYGDTFISYNVHSLLHLADDVRFYDRSLNDFSAFRLKTIYKK